MQKECDYLFVWLSRELSIRNESPASFTIEMGTRPETGAAPAWLQGQGESDGKIITNVLLEIYGIQGPEQPKKVAVMESW